MDNSLISEYDSQNLDKLVRNVVQLLELGGYTVSTAESCTGGLLSQLITSVPGASAVFEGGFCTYSNRMKTKLLNVPEYELEHFGAVSSQVALSMAKGLKASTGADVCVSVTGIAGPGGGTAEKPVGTVWFGFSAFGREFTRLPELWTLADKSRGNIRLAAAAFAFSVIEEILLEDFQ
ncbi:MAG: CinA family protein [Ruminococcus sp.]|nr:CinA family protein [Ruminococcus sp.]MBR6670591.1 CinA family protein [Ruminococcus sp.]